MIDAWIFSIESLNAVKHLILPNDLKVEILNTNFQCVIEKALRIQNDESQNGELSVFAAYIKKAADFRQSFAEDDEGELNTENESLEYDYTAPDYLEEDEKEEWKREMEERSNQRKQMEKLFLKNLPIVRKWTQEETNQNMFSFIVDNCSLLSKGRSRTLFNQTMKLYYSSLGIYFYFLPQSIQLKFVKAEEFCKSEIDRNFDLFQESQIPLWTEEISKLCREQGLKKVTKSFIKDCFKQRGLKVSLTTIDRIKYSID